jgi:hypothetical protein
MTGPATAIWLTAGPGPDPQSLCVVWDCRNHLQSAERKRRGIHERCYNPTGRGFRFDASCSRGRALSERNGSADKTVYTRICIPYPP